MRNRSLARIWHLITAAVGAFALVAQLVLVFTGASVLVDGPVPPVGSRLLRFISYFTIQSNVLVLFAAITLARDPRTDGPGWRVLRLAGTIGIAVTGVVHWFLLRPLLDLTGWSYLTDKLLHVAVPLLAVVGWLVFGPRPRISLRTVGYALIWPIAWLAYTMIMGAITAWYPYPFLDIRTHSVGSVVIVCVFIAVAFVGLSLLAWLADRRLPAARRPAPITR